MKRPILALATTALFATITLGGLVGAANAGEDHRFGISIVSDRDRDHDRDRRRDNDRRRDHDHDRGRDRDHGRDHDRR